MRRSRTILARAASIALLSVMAAVLVAVVLELPVPGDPDAPAHTHVGSRYLEQGVDETGVENMVTAVLLDYRVYDTFGEAAVIFTALVGVLAVLSASGDPLSAREGSGFTAERDRLTRYVVARATPVAVIFGAYLVFQGADRPGGAFQGGVVAGAAMISYTLAAGRDDARRLLPDGAAQWLNGSAMFAFLGFALLGTLVAGGPFAYPADPAPEWLKMYIKLFLEAGIGLAGAAILTTIFWALKDDRR